MQRTPVTIDRPACFSTYKNDGECVDCSWRSQCSGLSEFFTERKTVEEWVYSLKSAKQKTKITPAELLLHFSREYQRMGGPARKPFLTERWRESLDRVIVACTAAGIDPKLYVRAQVETIGWWTAKNKKPFYANMLQGANAQSRFEKWRERNRQFFTDGNYIRDEKEDKVLEAEMFFVEVYFQGGPARDAAALTKKRFPDWNLGLGRQKPFLRMSALQAYLAAINPMLPRRITLTTSTWKWGSIRKCVNKFLIT